MKNIRNDLTKWKEYIPVESAEQISMRQNIKIEAIDKLDAGESVYGPSPLVAKRLLTFKGYQFYPDPKYWQLRREIGKYTKVSPERIFVSNGADEIIDLLQRLIIDVGDEVIDCPPTFSSYSISSLLNQAIVVNVPRNSDYSVNSDKIINSITSKTKLAYICSPNNPTGNDTSLNEIEKLLQTGIYVCIDEAYIEFGGISAVSMLKKYPNLIIIRSFSKWAGIAGLRLGYALMSKELVKQLMKIKSPYNVNSAAVIAGIASLQDEKYRKKVIKTIIKERRRMELILVKTEMYKVAPSLGNFIFIKTSKSQLNSIRKKCRKRGIFVRFYTSQLIGYAVRITIGKPIQNNKVINLLKKYS